MVVSPVHFIAVPLLAAFLMPILAKVNKNLLRIVPGIVLTYLGYVSVVLMNRVATEGTIIEVLAGWSAPWGINLVYTPFTGFLATLMIAMSFLIWLYSFKFKKVDDEPALKYFILQLMLTTGSVGLVLTGDIFNFFVFMEIIALSSYALTAFYRDRNGAEAAFKYLLIGAFASTLFLLAIVLLYSQVGTLNMAEISVRMHDVPTSMKVSILVLFLVGIGIEAEMFPLNGWAPDAYSQAPSPVGVAFAALVVKAGVYGLVRITYTLFGIEGSGIGPFLIIMGGITLVMAEITALKQTSLKRMLAYSSIGQMGFVLIAFGIGTHEAVFGAIFLMFNHAIIKGLLFMSGSYLVYNTPNKEIKYLSGYGMKMPVISLFFSLGALAIVGLPPFAGFWSKLYILLAAADGALYGLIALILVVSIIEIVYYFRVVGRLYFGKPAEGSIMRKPTVGGMIAMSILAIAILVVGFYPDIITGYIDAAASSILNTDEYIKNALGAVNELTPVENIIQ
ncbi:MAG: proton-conducting membrane transporter [Bacteroidetes bacterium 4572_112]|nr:MAG: proton-conducting membrane transporter [Bacteroidetes bacterium 4572_112]